MDGLKKQVTGSLQRRLSVWLCVTIAGIALVAGAFSFYSAFGEAHELQDDVLRQVAMLFDERHLAVPVHPDAQGAQAGDPESRVFVQMLPAGPTAPSGGPAGPQLPFPANLLDGLQTARLSGTTYRILVRTVRPGQRLVVAQDTAVRDEIARDSALRTVTPFLILIPVLLLLVAGQARRIFAPVAALADEIDGRVEHELHPIALDLLPAEIRSFAAAVNRLLARVAHSVESQRRFVADAAHELRSPLTALSLQAERLAATDMSPAAHHRLVTLRSGIERGRTLLDQLLALAQAQAAPRTSESSAVCSVQDVFRRVLEDLMPLAHAKAIDIGVLTDGDVAVAAGEVDLLTIIRNLVDNAIRYTPAGGRIDLSASTTGALATLVVEDTGPGIPEAEHERVFDPFYRVLGSDEIGSGLGLSIVQTIARRIGATTRLAYADCGTASGLRVTVILRLAT